MSKIKVGSLIQFKGRNNRPMRVLRISGDKVLTEYIYKINYLGEKVYSKSGQGVLEEVNIWEIEKFEKPGLSGESTRLWALSSTPIYSPRENRY
jgi:hypothetical protein